MAYTYRDLRETVDSVNSELDRHGIDWMFRAQRRNGYTALDGGNCRDVPRGRVERCHAAGTPAQCSDQMFVISFWKLSAKLDEVKSNG